MSSMLLPTAARAPKWSAPIYTASAPWSMAAMPHSRLRAGASSSTDFINVVWSFLIDVIVYPVAIQQVSVSAPRYDWFEFWIIVTIIVDRYAHVVAHAEVATIFAVECVRRIFEMTCYIKLTSATRHDDADATLRRLSDDREVGTFVNILSSDFCMSAVRHEKDVVEAPEDRHLRLECILSEDAKHLLLKRILGNAVMTVKASLRRPANIHCRSDVSSCPRHDSTDLV